MNTQEALSSLRCVKNDCRQGYEHASRGTYISWEAPAWKAMVELLEDVERHIMDQEQHLTCLSWESNPDRMGK